MRCDLVLEGGGVKGIALVGAVDVLEERGYEVHRVAGTSAGAIVGALVASGMTREARKDLMTSVDYGAFQDEGFLDRFPGGKLVSLLTEQGIYEGEYVRRWVSEQLEGCGVRTFADLALPDDEEDPSVPLPGPGERGLRSRLVVMASDVTSQRLRALPDDYPELGVVDPSAVPVADAVRASMSIPFFYEPVRLKRDDGPDVVLVDGGMLSNFPVGVFDRAGSEPPRWPTFGIKLSARPGSQAAEPVGDGVLDLVKAMIATMTGFYDQMHLDDPGVLARTMFVDTFGVKATDFDLGSETRDRLYASGRKAAEDFLAGWDFGAYVAEFRS